MTIRLEGRLVQGHPLRKKAKLNKDNTPKLNKLGLPQAEAFIAVAVPKQAGQDWKQTTWGAALHSAAVAAWPRGEHGAPSFAWKVTDGDSTVPNKNGVPPNTREGYPGHWVIACATQLDIGAYHIGHYKPHEQITSENDIKCGDYCAVVVDFDSNKSTESPGMYINPKHFVRTAPGEYIASLDSGPSAEECFADLVAPPGATGATTPPPPAQGATTPPAPPTPPTPPAPHNPLPKRYMAGGVEYTYEQLKGYGWNEEQIAAAEVK